MKGTKTLIFVSFVSHNSLAKVYSGKLIFLKGLLATTRHFQEGDVEVELVIAEIIYYLFRGCLTTYSPVSQLGIIALV